MASSATEGFHADVTITGRLRGELRIGSDGAMGRLDDGRSTCLARVRVSRASFPAATSKSYRRYRRRFGNMFSSELTSLLPLGVSGRARGRPLGVALLCGLVLALLHLAIGTIATANDSEPTAAELEA